MIAPSFVQCAQVAQPFWSPKLTGPFETALFLTTGGLHRSRAYRPASPRYGLIIHPAAMGGEVFALPFDHFSSSSAPLLKSVYLPQHFLFLPVPQSMQARFDPLG